MEPVRTTFRAMASAHELALWHADAAHARRIAEAVVADVRRIEAKYSRYRDASVVSTINRAAGGAPVAIDAETVALRRPLNGKPAATELTSPLPAAPASGTGEPPTAALPAETASAPRAGVPPTVPLGQSAEE